jgi:hypothetical protein
MQAPRLEWLPSCSLDARNCYSHHSAPTTVSAFHGLADLAYHQVFQLDARTFKQACCNRQRQASRLLVGFLAVIADCLVLSASFISLPVMIRAQGVRCAW